MQKISELELHEVSSHSYSTSSIEISGINTINPTGTYDTEENTNQDEAPAELQNVNPFQTQEHSKPPRPSRPHQDTKFKSFDDQEKPYDKPEFHQQRNQALFKIMNKQYYNEDLEKAKK